MILTLLRTGELGWSGLASALRATYYTGSLGGAGLAFFALMFGRRRDVVDVRKLGRWAAAAALLGLASAAGVLIAEVGDLTAGEAFLDHEVWGVVLASRAGASYAVGGIGLVLLAALLLGAAWAPLASVGGVLVCISYGLLGHTSELAPRPLLAGLLFVHLMVAAFWIGSLAPLAWAARRDGPGVARLVEDWARVAAAAVPILVVAGLLLAWWILGGIGELLGSWYGWALLAKLCFVAVLLCFAAWHRFRLTPALAARAPGAAARLARSILAEAVVALLVLWAAAEMVSTSPGGMPGAG